MGWRNKCNGEATLTNVVTREEAKNSFFYIIVARAFLPCEQFNLRILNGGPH